MSNWQQAMPTPAAYWIDRVLYEIHHDPVRLDEYTTDPDAYLGRFPLSDGDRESIRDNAIGTMYLSGVNPYLLRAHCLGMGVAEDTFVASLREVGEEARRG